MVAAGCDLLPRVCTHTHTHTHGRACVASSPQPTRTCLVPLTAPPLLQLVVVLRDPVQRALSVFLSAKRAAGTWWNEWVSGGSRRGGVGELLCVLLSRKPGAAGLVLRVGPMDGWVGRVLAAAGTQPLEVPILEPLCSCHQAPAAFGFVMLTRSCASTPPTVHTS